MIQVDGEEVDFISNQNLAREDYIVGVCHVIAHIHSHLINE